MAEGKPNGYRSLSVIPAMILSIGVPMMLLFRPVPAFSQQKETVSREARLDEVAIRKAFLKGTDRPGGAGPTGEIVISAQGRHLTLSASLGSGVANETVTCLLCTQDEAESAARSLGATMGAKAAGKPPATIDISVDPTERVSVDSIPLAPAVGVHTLEPGEHEISITTPEGTRWTRLPLSDGDKLQIPRLDTFEKTSRNPIRIRAGIASSGVGLILAAVGTTFLILDGRCVTVDTHCDSEHQLKGAGIGLIAVGALLQGVLAWSLFPEKSTDED